jgi:Zn-dependent oligopeptidase
MFAGMEDRLKVNVPVLDEILELRRKCAELLGYESWAAYVLEDRMIKSAVEAKRFLVDLQQKLLPIGQKDLNNLLALKKEECDKANIAFDGQLNVWDWRYFDRLYVEKTYSLDQDRVKEHFPVEVVVPAIMDIYKKIFNARITEVKDNVVWHQGMKMILPIDVMLIIMYRCKAIRRMGGRGN